MVKTIELDDDLAEFFKTTAELLNTQDNRHTDTPIFRIYDEIKVEKRDGCGDHLERLTYEGAEEHYCSTCQSILEESDYDYDKLPEIGEDGCLCDVTEDAHWTYDIDLLPAASAYDGVAFLTEKEAQEYLDDNHYHFGKGAVVYAESAFRNYELKTIIKGIKAIGAQL